MKKVIEVDAILKNSCLKGKENSDIIGSVCNILLKPESNRAVKMLSNCRFN